MEEETDEEDPDSQDSYGDLAKELIKDGPPPEMKTSSVTPKTGSYGGKANKVATLTNNHLGNICSQTLELENTEAHSRLEDELVTIKD